MESLARQKIAFLLCGLLLTPVSIGAPNEPAIKGAPEMHLTGAEDPEHDEPDDR